MAANDNQGLQIALIIFVMLTIILSVTTYLFYDKSRENFQKAEAATKSAQEAQGAKQVAERDLTTVKGLVGFPPTAAVDADIQPTHAADIAALSGANLPTDKQTYRDALKFLFDAFNEKNAALANAEDKIQQLTDAVDQARAEKEAGIAAAVKAQQAAEQDLQNERTKFNNDRERLTQEKEALAAEKSQLQKQVEELAAEKRRNEDQLLAQLSQTKQRLQFREEQYREATATQFEVPDGEVRSVINRRVYINLGRADNLRPQMTFSVYGTDPNSVANVENKKGSIEVTEVLGPHLAEALILEDTLSDPIVPGDKIESPLFKVGRPQRFGLAGFLDIDGDGKEDREAIRNIITMNGGIIDSEMGLDGVQTGQLTVNTRYVVLGEPPLDSRSGGNPGANDAYVKFRDQARELGLDIVNLDKFLNLIGWTAPSQSVTYGRGGTAATARPPVPDGGRPAAPGHTSELFRTRRPPRSVNGSAFSN